jgi:Flp pilus assembly protein TadG
MRPQPWRTETSRSRERGVAVVELALILPFIAMIVLALVDYGYYFYIGINATEAARTAAVQASDTALAMHGGTGPTSCTDASIALVTGAAPAAPAQAAKDYMTAQVNSTIGNNTTATVACAATTTGGQTAFSIQVQVTFAPPSGTVHFGLPRSGTKLVYKTPKLWRRF